MANQPGVRMRMSTREWTLVLLLVASVIINYIDRSNLSLAVPIIQHQFALTPVAVGSLLSAFFWTYALMQLCGLAGWLSDRFPVGWVMLGGYVVWSCATMMTGLVTGFGTLYLSRLLLGMGESVAYPCYSRVFAELPQAHRGRANAMIDAGTKIGPAIGAFVGGLLLVHFGWRVLFVALGAGGLVWIVPWMAVMPRVSRRAQVSDEALPSILQLLHVPAAWGSFVGHFCGNYFFYFLLAWLPSYFVTEEKLPLGAMSRLTSAIFLLIAISTLLAGGITDRLIVSGHSPTRVRKAAVVGGLALASSLIALVLVRNNLPVSLAIMGISCIGYGAFASNHWAITQTLAGPMMAGRWSSVQNGVANLSGIVAPWITGYIVKGYGSLRLSFVLTGAVALLGACSWGFLVRRVEPVQWAASEPKFAVQPREIG